MFLINTKKAIKELDKQYQDLSDRERRAAMARAMNRAITSGRANSAKQARKQYNIKSSDVKKTMAIKRATSSSPREAQLISTGSTLPINSFRPSKTKKGVTVKIKNTRKLFPGAFFAVMKSGHKGIFARAQYKGNKLTTRRTRVNRYPLNDLPITEVKTLSVPNAIANKQVLFPLSSLIQQKFIGEYAYELKFRQSRAALNAQLV